MTNIHNPHDRLFKEIWSQKESAASFLQNYLPENLLSHVDLGTLEICKDSFVQKDLTEYFSDILYSVSLGNQEGYIYLLFEHKSYCDDLLAFQLFGYMQNIWTLHFKQKGEQGDKGLPLPVIVPMVIYHGAESWCMGNTFAQMFQCEDTFQEYVPNFRYILYDLSRYSDEEIKGEIVLRITLLLFKYVQQKDYDARLLRILRLLRELVGKKTGMEYIETILRYVFATVNMTVNELKEIVEETLSVEQGGIVMTLAERCVQQGIQKGVERSIRKLLFKGMTPNNVAALLDIDLQTVLTVMKSPNPDESEIKNGLAQKTNGHE